MQSESQDTQEELTWSGQGLEDGQPTDDTTTKSHSDPCSTTSNHVIHVDELTRSYVTSVAGGDVSPDDTEEYLLELEDWYDHLGEIQGDNH